MRFYKKDADPRVAIAECISESYYETRMPRTFEEQAVRIFCRCSSRGPLALLGQAFSSWCKVRVPSQTVRSFIHAINVNVTLQSVNCLPGPPLSYNQEEDHT
jgi:hypothetical protein